MIQLVDLCAQSFEEALGVSPDEDADMAMVVSLPAGAVKARSPLDPAPAAFDNVHQFFQIDLAGVAPRGLQQGAVGGAEVDAFLRASCR